MFFSLSTADSPPNKSTRVSKSISAADQDLDWRSARSSTPNTSPSTAFKSLYKNSTLRAHAPNSYSSLKQNSEGERRDSLGPETEPSVLPHAARLRRFRNSSPRNSECSNRSSDNETAQTVKLLRDIDVNNAMNAHTSSHQEVKECFTPDEELKLATDKEQDVVATKTSSNPVLAEKESISCTNSFSILPMEEDAEQSNEDVYEASVNIIPAEDPTVNPSSPEGKTETLAFDAEEVPDDLECDDSFSSPKKNKAKPRRRRFKKNKKTATTEEPES